MQYQLHFEKEFLFDDDPTLLKPSFRGIMEHGSRLFVTWIDNEHSEMKFKEDFAKTAASLETHDKLTEFSFDNHIGYISSE